MRCIAEVMQRFLFLRGERSERESVVPRQKGGGHAPPQRHLERSAVTTKTRFTGRKRPNELLAK